MPRLRLAGAGVKKRKKAQVCQLLFAPLFHINGKQHAKVNKTNTENTVWLRQRQQGCVLRGRVAITDESVGIFHVLLVAARKTSQSNKPHLI